MRQRMAEKLGVTSAAHVGAAIKAQYASAAGAQLQHRQAAAPSQAAAATAASLQPAAASSATKTSLSAGAARPPASVALSLLGDYDDRCSRNSARPPPNNLPTYCPNFVLTCSDSDSDSDKRPKGVPAAPPSRAIAALHYCNSSIELPAGDDEQRACDGGANGAGRREHDA